MIKSVSYLQIVAGRLRELFDRKLEGQEWGRAGSIIKKYRRASIEEVLQVLESEKNLTHIDVTMGMFQFLVKQGNAGKDMKASLGYFINNTVSQKAEALLETQHKGRAILGNITNGS